MKICFTSYFGLREALQAAADQLASIGHQILDYPLFMNNIHLETKVDDIVEDFSNFIEENKPDGIFWWCLSIDNKDFIAIKERFPKLKYWYFNWDEPYNWHDAQLEVKSPYFDCVFVSCLESTSRYLIKGCPKAIYCLPGFDPEMFFPHNDPDYKFDISIILTNLYSDETRYPDQIINRQKLVDAIYDGQVKGGYRFAIYGPESLRERYPDSYQGYCHYTELNDVFNQSRINLTTHVIGNQEGYLNERTVTLIGSGALILIDPVKGLKLNLLPGKNCLILDTDNPVEQIIEILRSYSLFSKVKENVKEIRSNYFWKIWAEKINNFI